MAQRISSDNFKELVLEEEKPVLVDFYSDTCIPCKKIAGILGEIEDAYEGRLQLYKVNVNYDERLAEEYRIMSAPTVVVFHKGEEKARLTGAVKKEELEKAFIHIV